MIPKIEDDNVPLSAMLKKMVKSRDLEMIKITNNSDDQIAKLKASLEVKSLEINELKAKVSVCETLIYYL